MSSVRIGDHGQGGYSNKKNLPSEEVFFIGAGEAIRTPDPNLGKVMLYP